MMKLDFDGELRGADGDSLPVYCEVQLPYLGGQKALVHIAVPAQYITEDPPNSPCVLSGEKGSLKIDMQGVHWRRFPTSSSSTFGLESVELLHIETVVVRERSTRTDREIRFHLGPISYLRSESSFIRFNNESHSEELFVLEIPGLGPTSFRVEWTTTYHRDEENLGATVNAGFSAVATFPADGPVDVDKAVASFKKSLDVLAVLFRQAVSVHGWTYTADGHTTSTWIACLTPNVTSAAREDRGDYVARPQVFVECANSLTQAYAAADAKIRSLVRHLSVAINPHNRLRDRDHFVFMFSAFERVIEHAWKSDATPNGPSVTTPVLIRHLEQLRAAIDAEGGEDAAAISSRIKGLIKVVNSPSIQDKLNSFFQVYPAMNYYSSDLWPISGKGKERGLREVRHALAHGSGSFVSVNVIAVAKWHLEILLERLVFVLLNLAIPEGILPNSFLLKVGARGWYERDWWVPLRSEPDQPI